MPILLRLGVFLAGRSLTTWLIAAGLLVGGLWYANQLHKSYRRGQESVLTKIKDETKEIEDAWKNIDGLRPTVGESISRLRERANRR